MGLRSMRQYVYDSTAEELAPEDIADILEVCQRNNAVRAITGMLIYNGRNFLQLIEGEADALAALMERIGQDSRHHGISVLYDEPADQRACPDWLMKRIALSESADTRRERLEADLPAALNPQLRQMILNFALLN